MREITNYEGLYSVEEDGRVWSHRSKKYLKATQLKNGYFMVSLSKEGKVVNKYIHRLVAEAYIPNPDNLPEVDHIDRNRQNNNVDNLRWVSRSGNMRNRKDCRQVVNLDTNEIFNSAAEAAETIKDQSANFTTARHCIGACCRGKAQTAYGMRWQYVDEYSAEI